MLRLASIDDQGQIDGDSLAVRAVGPACREHRDEHERPNRRETGPIVLNAHCEAFTFSSLCLSETILSSRRSLASPDFVAGKHLLPIDRRSELVLFHYHSFPPDRSGMRSCSVPVIDGGTLVSRDNQCHGCSALVRSLRSVTARSARNAGQVTH